MKRSLLFITFCAVALSGAGCFKKQPVGKMVPPVVAPTVDEQEVTVAFYAFDGALLDRTNKTYLFQNGDRLRGSVYDAGYGEPLDLYGMTSGSLLLFNLMQAEAVIAHATATWEGEETLVGERMDAQTKQRKPFRLERTQAPDSAVIVGRSAEEEWYVNGDTGCEVSFQYPEIKAGGIVSQAAADFMNRTILQALTASSTQSFQDEAGRVVAECQAYLEGQVQEMGSDPEQGFLQSWYTGQTFDVSVNQRGILSLVFFYESFTGGAHGNYHQDALNFDLKTGQRLSLGDFVKDDKLEEFMKREKRLILQHARESLFEEEAVAFSTFVQKKTVPSAVTQRKEYGSFDGFYLTPSGLMTFYSPYEIAPYAAGLQEFFLPYKNWSDLRKPSSPLELLIK